MAQATVELNILDVKAVLKIQPLHLKLVSAFGTSHSTTTARQNALVKIEVEGKMGLGESGLPPKKPGVYHADYHDCLYFFSSYTEQLKKAVEPLDEASLNFNPFTKVTNYFETSPSHQGKQISILRFLFAILDSTAKDKQHRSCHGAIEHALLDLWGQFTNLSVHALIGLQDLPKTDLKTFFTVSLNPDLNIIEQETKRASNIYLQGSSILNLVIQITQNITPNYLLCLDANAAWTPDLAKKYLQIFAPIKDKIYMVEQPFPVHIEPSEFSEWVAVKNEYTAEGVLIYADESVSNSDDIIPISQICHGVNIKLDKTGGIREALNTISEAKANGLKLWLGTMVSSQLSMSTASHILPLTKVSDLDGSILITKDSNPFIGGCQIRAGIVSVSTNPGIGCTLAF